MRNLESWFDSHLDVSAHISKLSSSTFYHLHNVSRIRSLDTTEALVHVFVQASRVDYWNSLLHGLPTSCLNKSRTACFKFCSETNQLCVTPLPRNTAALRAALATTQAVDYFKILLFVS
mgnify:CR=1 FL=1